VLEISPTQVSFGDVTIGSRVERSFLIRNRGRGPIGAELLQGPAEFEVDPPSVHLVPGAQLSVSLRYEAGEADLGPASIEWKTSQGASFSIGVDAATVTAPFTMASSSVDFGDLQVGETKAVDIEIVSLVDHELEFRLPIPTNEDLEWSQTAVFLVPRGSHWISLIYTASDRGDLDEVLSLQGCARCDWFELSVKGRGMGRAFQVVPGGVDFGDVPVGSPESRSLRIQNTGDVPLDLDPGVARPPFEVIAEAEGYRLAPGEEATIQVRFEPTEGGLRGVSFRVRDRGSQLYRDVLLRGTGGSRLVGIPAELDFGLVHPGFSLRKTLLLQNIGLPRTIEIESVGFGVYSPAFRVVDQKVGEWIGSTALPLEIDFRSYDEGVFAAELLVRTSDASQILKIPMRGEVGPVADVEDCELGFHPKAIHTGIVRAKRVQNHKAFIANEGSVPCFIREIDWNIGHAYVDPVLHPFEPTLLAPGESTMVEVTALTLIGGGESWYTLDLLLGGQATPTHTIEYLSYSSDFAPIATPNQLIFEPLPVGAEATRLIQIADPDSRTTVRSLSLSEESDPAFTLVTSEEPGDPADGLVIEVSHAPTASGFQHGQVVLHLADFDEPMRIDVIGVGLDPSP